MSILWKLFAKDARSAGDIRGNCNFEILRPELQQRFSNGVKYNMKLVIRGARRSGKTSLFTRLKGETFNSEYKPTDEIQVACIRWNYEGTNEVIKVEVWDVVDKGRPREPNSVTKIPRYLKKLAGANYPLSNACLDSNFVDVYKGACGVIMIFDINLPPSFEYVQRELPRVPPSLPVLIMGNFRDLATNHRAVPACDVHRFIDEVARQRSASLPQFVELDEESAPISAKAHLRYCESSMLNGFGLVYVHRFLNIPFLSLQRACLLRLLAENNRAYSSSQRDLNIAESGDGVICNYDKFVHYTKTSMANFSSNADVSASAYSSVQSPPSWGDSPPDACIQSSHNYHADIVNGYSKLGNSPEPRKHKSSPLVAEFQEEIDPSDSHLFTNINTSTPIACYRQGDSVTVLKSRSKPSCDARSSSSIDAEFNAEVIETDDNCIDDDVPDVERHFCPDLGQTFYSGDLPSRFPGAGPPSFRSPASPHTVSAESCSSSSSPVAQGNSKVIGDHKRNQSSLSIDFGADARDALERFLDDI